MKYCVYKITNEINGKVYIGMTKLRPERRWKGGSGYRKQPAFYDEILKFGWENFKTEVIAEGLDRDEAIATEAQLIASENSIQNGYNISGGMRDMTCAPKVVVDKYDPLTGELLCTYESIAKAAKDVKTPDSHIVEACQGKHAVIAGYGWAYHGAEYTKPKRVINRNRNVQMMDKTGEILAVFCSLDDAARAVGMSKATICLCCKGKLQTGGGFAWRYE